MYLYYLKNNISEQSIQKMFNLILKKTSLVCRGVNGKGSTWRLPIIQAFLLTIPFGGLQLLSAWWVSWLGSTVNKEGETEEDTGSLPFAPYARVQCPLGSHSNSSSSSIDQQEPGYVPTLIVQFVSSDI